jgi:putative RecB family exonuclease
VEALSVSQVQAYLACPLKYRFRYIDRIPKPWRTASLAFGTSIHAALEWFHRERLEGRAPPAADVLSVFDADWYAQTVEPLVYSGNDSKETLAEKGHAMLHLYMEQALSLSRPSAVEERFATELADPETGEDLAVSLHGVIDLIEEDGTIVEIKTAGRTLERGGLDHHLQLSTYALAVFLLRGAIPRLRLDLLLKTKAPRLERHETSRTLSDLSWAARLIEDVRWAIDTNRFYPNPSWRCAECEYFAHCQAWRGNHT